MPDLLTEQQNGGFTAADLPLLHFAAMKEADGGNPATFDALAYEVLQTALAAGVGQPYDIAISFEGAPTDGQRIARFVIPAGRTLLFSADFASSAGYAPDANPTATAAFDVQDDGVSIGTVTIGTGGGFTFATDSNEAQTVAGGSVVDIIAPGTADATLEGVYFTLYAMLTAAA